MAERKWQPIPIYAPVYTNVAETALRNGQAALENGYVTEARGHARFPTLKNWIDLDTPGRVYLKKVDDELYAVTSLGRVFRIGADAVAQDVTGTLVTGGKRPIFAPTADGLLIAAGGPIVTMRSGRSMLLAGDPPQTTHVGYVDGYVLAMEPGSARFRFSAAGTFTSWPVSNTETANAQHDRLTAIIINDFAEMLALGPDSIEQWERNASGTRAFYRRWTVADGLYTPYGVCLADNAVFIINKKRELARVSGQLATPVSRPIQATLERIDDWSETWMDVAEIAGQRFIILQMPHATNPHGTKGVTVAYDYAQRRFSFLYGWDEALGVQARWKGWSIASQWQRTFVGGDDGRVYQLDAIDFQQDAGPEHMIGRSGHFDLGNRIAVNNLRIRMERGRDTSEGDAVALIQVRMNRDNRGWTPWIGKPLGRAGQRFMEIYFGALGAANTWQFEYRILDAMPINIVDISIQTEPLGG